MSLTFDHSICTVPTLGEGVAGFEKAGFVVSQGGTHTTGTHNAVVPLDVGYLEILSVHDEEQARKTQRHGAICDYIRDHRGGLIGYALRTDDIDADARRLATSGISFEGPQDAHRVLPDGKELRWRVLRPTPQPAPAPLPMIVWGDESASGSHDHANTIKRAASLSIVARSLDRLCRDYERYLGVAPDMPRSSDDLNAREASILLDGFTIRLLEPTGSGPVSDALDRVGDGPYDMVLEAADVMAAENRTTGGIIDPALTFGTRLRITPSA